MTGEKRSLDRVRLENYKSIKALDLELRKVNILIGANGAGKSNLISFLSLLNAMVEKRLQEFVVKEGGAGNLLHFGPKESTYIQAELYFQRNYYKFRLEYTKDDKLSYAYEEVGFDRGDNDWFAYYINSSNPFLQWSPYESRLEEEARNPGFSGGKSIAFYVYHSIKSWRVYHFHDTSPSSPLRRACDINDNRFLREDGSNLPAFLYMLKHKYPEHYNLIESTFRSYVPAFDRFILEPQVLNPERIRLEWKPRGKDQTFSALHMSDGSLRLLCLLTLFLQPEELMPSTIIVDEPELGLHPAGIYLLSELIKASPVQVIASTQSPNLVKRFEPEDVIVAEYKDGRSTFNRLERENLVQWLEDYSLGELWEKNLIGGRP